MCGTAAEMLSLIASGGTRATVSVDSNHPCSKSVDPVGFQVERRQCRVCNGSNVQQAAWV